jgi:tuftelin-interacting protein 11
VGGWEKYEKGFGSKMLLRMGWQKGMGLGKEGQGRAIPVEATVRKGKGAVGRYGAESREAAARQGGGEQEGSDSGEESGGKWGAALARAIGEFF